MLVFLYAITDISQHAKNIKSNYICMSLPYMGIFAYGSEQWSRKIGLTAPSFNEKEKDCYIKIRQGHKLFEKNYEDYYKMLFDAFAESDKYFCKNRNLEGEILEYYNVGTDLCNGEFCGNTVLCMIYLPMDMLGSGIKKQSIIYMGYIAGKLAGYFGCNQLLVYKYNDNI